MVDLIKKSDCTGCKMCEDICPCGAITFRNEKDGFWYPVVDSEKCTRCGLCLSKCPVQRTYTSKNKGKPEVYSAWIRDDRTRINSTSGGIYYALAQQTIKEGGYIVGGVYSEDYKSAYHIVGNSMEDLKRIMRSKYFQSDTSGIFKLVKQLLDDKKKVLFCGTPCQAAALTNYLPKEYDDLTICDFICRGINSPKAFRAYIESLEHKYKSKVSLVHLKNKNHGWRALGTYMEFQNGQTYFRNKANDPWVNGYISGNLYMRKCCSHCKFKKIPRVSDISLGDFWGIKGSKEDMKKGISLVMINSEKGMTLFNSVNSQIHKERNTLEKAIEGNRCIIESAPMGKQRYEFFECVDKEHFESLVWRLLGQSKWRQCMRTIKYNLSRIKENLQNIKVCNKNQ